MSGKINVKAVVAFVSWLLICIVVLIIFGSAPFDILVAIVFWTALLLVGYLIDRAGLGKCFGGK